MQNLRASLSENMEDYRKEGILSSIWQGCGRVVLATHTPTSVSLVIKIFDLEKCSEDFDLIQHEARMLREVRHPNLCCLVGSLCVGQEAWLLLPRHLCSVATLLHSQHSFGLPELAIAVVARDILLALQYLHARGIIHRNVQARHVLVSPCGRAVLSGLRHSVHHRQPGAEGHRTLHCYPRHPAPLLNWASPEMLHQDLRGYSFPTDVYSLGLTVCELGNAEQPYQGLPPTLMLVQKLKGLVPFLHDASNMDDDDCSEDGKGSSNSLASNGGLHLSDGGISTGSSDGGKMAAQQKRHFTIAAHQFVRRTLALEPHCRPSVQELLNTDPFIRQARKAANCSLVALLHLKDVDHTMKDDGHTQELENQLSRATIDDTSWTFETA